MVMCVAQGPHYPVRCHGQALNSRNLGYLPRGYHRRATLGEPTLAAPWNKIVDLLLWHNFLQDWSRVHCTFLNVNKSRSFCNMLQYDKKKIDQKHLPRIQSKLNVITSPIAQETRRSYMAGECSAEQAMVQMIAVRVATARKLMHENPEGQSNRAKRQFISFDVQLFILNIRNKYLSFCSWPKSNSFT